MTKGRGGRGRFIKDSGEKEVAMQELENDGASKPKTTTTTIAIRKSTKDKLDRNRAPGQCYNGFICQLIDLWEKTGEEKIFNRAGFAGGNQGARGDSHAR